MDKVNYVKQEHLNGCVVASLAMVLGKSYTEVHDEIAPLVWWYDYELAKNEFKDNEERTEACWKKGIDFSERGITLDDAYRWLGERGWASQLRYKVYPFDWKARREDWPPKPWAPIHLCSVQATRGSHAIVMLRDGSLLDPWRPPGTWCGTFDEYSKVEQVCGLWKVY